MDHSRIIRGAVGGGRYTVTAPITQWDYGYLFLPEIDDLPATYRLDFSNDEHHGTALSVYCGADGGEVPEELIDTGKDIFVWYFYIGDGYGKTEYKWRIPNKCKPKGDGETPEPSQQSSIDQLIYVANEVIDTAHESASQASASAQSASESAEQAQESARTAGLYSDTAQTYANSAEISANSASASATASAQSAEASARCSADAQDSAEDAQASASASAQSATASANSASQASASATSASQSATSAQGYASQAQTSAQTASTKASEASTSASTASAKASEALSSALSASSYATQAETAKTFAQTAQGLAESARDDAIDAKTDAESARDEAQNIVDSINAKAEQIDQNTADIASIEEDIFKPYATDSASGSIASFVDGADDIPLKSLIVNIDPVQDTSSGDPSPENICPISGWTECNIQRTGKNLFDPTVLKDQLSWNIITLHLTPNTLYVMSTDSDVSTLNVYFLRDGESQGGGTKVTASHPVVRLTGNDGILKIIQRRSSGSESFSNYHYQIEIGSTPTPYEPYQGQTLLISWQSEAGTVYGGYIDVLSGVMRITQIGVDLSAQTWKLKATGTTHKSMNTQLPMPYVGHPRTSENVFNPILEQYTKSGGGFYTGANDSRITNPDAQTLGYLYFSNSTAPRASIFYMIVDVDSTPSGMIVYNIAEPFEIQLTPHEVNSLLGQNNIFADTGDTSAEYRANTQLWVQKKITEAVAAALNS